ncbi:TPA: hypothetical protein ACPEYO_003788, partial [Klebsiella pneumoniae]
MTRYNTGYPVPSPAMPDVWDNNETIDSFVNSPENSVTTRTGIVRDTMFGMQKKADEQRIAASVALAEQMDSQESAFNAAQTDKEDRFQGFLNSSGYVFLGNYENGPFQFSARNQYIRYNNQYYRLNAATDIGFTTTGTDANSFANDVTHFVLMDGDTLRQNLGSGDGLKWVGKCATISALRTVEPTYSGQSITLRHAVSGGHEINCSLWYDADDVTTDDDGYSVFVTAGGARWKADVSRGIDIRLAGLLSDNSNLGTVLNAVITGEVNKIKAAGTIKGAITNIFIPASRKVYTVDTPVFIPSFMCMNTNGYVYMNYPSATGSAFSINNAALDIASGGMPSNP